MEELLGVKVKMEMKEMKGMVRVERGNKLMEGVNDFGVDNLLSPVFYPDGEVEVLAKYEDGMPAVWGKKRKQFNSIHIGTLIAPTELLRNIARKAGVHIYSDKNDVVEADEEFLSITARDEGEREVKLKKATVEDALTGEVLGKSIDRFKIYMRKGETRLFLLK
jgi:hypothetical protein